MLKNYFKTAWRNLVRNKGYSAINIGGLAVGMAIAMLIGLWVYDELNFDKYYKNYDRIAQVMQRASFNGKLEAQTSNPGLMGPAIRSDYGSNFKQVVQTSWIGGHLVAYGNNTFNNIGIYAEPGIVDMLSLRMLQGNNMALIDPYSIVLSASTAKAIFGNKDPMGKVVKYDRSHALKVTGVYEDFPSNTSFSEVKMIMPWELWLVQNPWAKEMENPWGSNFSQTFVQIADGADMKTVSDRIKGIKMKYTADEDKRYNWEVFLQPMSKWHLYNDFKNGVNIGGNIRYVWLFGIIGAFVLLLACINFMNLSTARSEKRAREVGIRKAIGSMRWQITRQFFMESYMVVMAAFLFSLLLLTLLLPLFNEVAGKTIRIPWQHPVFWLANGAFVLVTGLLAGSYPALYLSSFNPLKVLKGTFKAGRAAVLPRRVLVVIQFTASVMLIIGTIIVYQQIQHARNRPIGYANNGLVNFGMENEIRKHFEVIRNELKNKGAIEEMTASNSPMTGIWNTNGGFDWEGKDPNLAVDFPNIKVTYDYGKTVKWAIKEGRDFSKTFATDSAAFVINESAAAFFGFKDPVGKTIRWENQPFTIIGVVKDILQESPFYPVRPTLYHIDDYDNLFNLIVRLNPKKSAAASVKIIQGELKKYTPDVPYEYQFVDENFGSKFDAEQRIGKLSLSFAILAVFISCLGLLGMASFVAEQKTKEIGIRKVLGASVANLWQLLSKEFVLLVVLSCLIATPVAYYYLNSWLSNYDYRVAISWKVFVFASLIALFITLATVSYQSIKAAIAYPIKSLRTE
ncbi:MAG: FtsX-like permease family protein [Chitinophagaceae bacterium]|nr:MAG: FtsX-like permease family protein [Chitinophagaceae bacterium]